MLVVVGREAGQTQPVRIERANLIEQARNRLDARGVECRVIGGADDEADCFATPERHDTAHADDSIATIGLGVRIIERRLERQVEQNLKEADACHAVDRPNS
jgi:hypothetical protein